MKPESIRWLPKLWRVKLNFIFECFLKEESSGFNLRMKQNYKINPCFKCSNSLAFCLYTLDGALIMNTSSVCTGGNNSIQ